MGLVKVLVVEDDESHVDALTVYLDREGFDVTVARDGVEALDHFRSAEPDVVLLDLMLPRLSGIDVCRAIRETSSVPIIMVTARSAELEAVVGLEVGADDYVTKPYRTRELVARMRAVLRRRPLGSATPAELGAARYLIGDVALDADRHVVTVRGENVDLPLRQFQLLELLLANAGRAVSREFIISTLWPPDQSSAGQSLDVHVKRLRSRIEVDPTHPTRIVTIRGLGYRYEIT